MKTCSNPNVVPRQRMMKAWAKMVLEKCLDAGYILKVKPIRFLDISDIGIKKTKTVEMT